MFTNSINEGERYCARPNLKTRIASEYSSDMQLSQRETATVRRSCKKHGKFSSSGEYHIHRARHVVPKESGIMPFGVYSPIKSVSSSQICNIPVEIIYIRE